MPTRRGPGRPLNPWRPRKIEQDYIDVSEGHHKPVTRQRVLRELRIYEAFLRQRAVDSDAVTIHDLLAFEAHLIKIGFTRYRLDILTAVRSYYLLKGSKNPESKWSRLAAELKTHRMPKPIGKKNPFKPYPLQLLPKILEASRHVVQHVGRDKAYSEAFAVTATFLYSGGRAQWYGLTTAQVKTALEKKYVELFVKEGEQVDVPVHDRLLEIWRKHLEERDFSGPMFFRYSRDPYTYQSGSKDWLDDARSSKANGGHVIAVLHGHETSGNDNVQRQLAKRFGIEERLTSHRFRKSVSTYMEKYGFLPSEQRLQMSHGASTITEFYTVSDVEEVQEKLSKIDLGSAEWVAAHDPPYNLFAGGSNNGVDQDLVVELRAQLQKERDRSDRLEQKIDELLARKVVA